MALWPRFELRLVKYSRGVRRGPVVARSCATWRATAEIPVAWGARCSGGGAPPRLCSRERVLSPYSVPRLEKLVDLASSKASKGNNRFFAFAPFSFFYVLADAQRGHPSIRQSQSGVLKHCVLGSCFPVKSHCSRSLINQSLLCIVVRVNVD